VDENEPSGKPKAEAAFTTTHWSVVLNAAEAGSPQAHAALSQLCEVYWYPLYVYVRRQGYSPVDSQDLTQEFFSRLLGRNYLRSIDREKGKFRSFLLAAMENFLAKHWRDAHRLKRGGSQNIISLDDTDAEGRYQIEPAVQATAEQMYERRWALTLIELTLKRVRSEFAAAKKLPLFETLEPFLGGERPDLTYAQAGATLDMTEGAVKVAMHRLRARYGELLREEIAKTVSTPDEVDQELKHLIEVLGR
jgi:RNA polymerase sigma factor (sigma-70 family)